MSKNVLDYEPHSALFVPDSDALIFYNNIADIAIQHLKNKGFLYFEINQAMSSQVMQLLKEKKFVNIELKQDLFANDRMIRAMKE